jgi:hypothetical protein
LAIDTQLAQLTLLPPPLEFDELLLPHPAASSAPLSASAATAMVFLLRTIPLRLVDRSVRTSAIVPALHEYMLFGRLYCRCRKMKAGVPSGKHLMTQKWRMFDPMQG